MGKFSQMIFVGEQTSYTHAWIASALESGIRGGVQLLLGESNPISPCGVACFIILIIFRSLELGLVDEAKDTVEKWMARWIEVVSKLPIQRLYMQILTLD